MKINALKVSEEFRKVAIRAVLSILLFLFTYIVMIILALALIVLCGYIAFVLVAFKAMFLTIMIGLGLIGMGFLILFFLTKFIFSSGKQIDRSHLTEITAAQQPKLFQLLGEIVDEVHTSAPKKVYLSSEVNASVFYDSTFWSMFFPVRKNLQIGVGLMNAVSVIELKAILAHEFGHFSQRSMKVGSYVYNVNKVIFNMLYDNEGYDVVLTKWSNSSSYFAAFSAAAIFVVKGVQRVLMRVYKVVNLNYMALSREMEFHADAVAAHVAGSEALANSLLRLDLASKSLSSVFDYYDAKIATSQKTNNFFPQQSFVLHHISTSENLTIRDGLPMLTIDEFKKFNRTKLVLSEQWSSHPSTEERVTRVLALDEKLKGESGGLAVDILFDKERVLELISDKLFEQVSFTDEPLVLGVSEFIDDYMLSTQQNAYPAVFEGYYEIRNPYWQVDLEEAELECSSPYEFSDLINDQSIGRLNELGIAINDRQTLEQIVDGSIEVESFDYDGVKYSTSDAASLEKHMESKITEMTTSFDVLDKELFYFFVTMAKRKDCLEAFSGIYTKFRDMSLKLEEHKEVYTNVVEAANFMQKSNDIDDIPWMVERLQKTEIPFKEVLKSILSDASLEEAIDTDSKNIFEEYLLKSYAYFGHKTYYQLEVDSLFLTFNTFVDLLFNEHLARKKLYLAFQADMLEEISSAQSA